MNKPFSFWSSALRITAVVVAVSGLGLYLGFMNIPTPQRTEHPNVRTTSKDARVLDAAADLYTLKHFTATPGVEATASATPTVVPPQKSDGPSTTWIMPRN